MRWYQHNTQGSRPITSLKNKLPNIETTTIIQHRNNSIQMIDEFSVVSEFEGEFIY